MALKVFQHKATLKFLTHRYTPKHRFEFFYVESVNDAGLYPVLPINIDRNDVFEFEASLTSKVKLGEKIERNAGSYFMLQCELCSHVQDYDYQYKGGCPRCKTGKMEQI